MPTTAAADIPVRSLQDILTALERHPEWRTALRQQLLGEELLELPAMFAKFASETTRRLDLLTQELAATNKRLDLLTTDVGGLKNDVGGLKNDVGSLKNDVGSLKEDVGSLKNDVGSLKNDVGQLKGAHAEARARADIELIAAELDLDYRRIVPRVELWRMARDAGADLQADEIKSFLASDVMAEAAEADGTTTYLAVEASYTGDLHDAHRARNHAALMQRFTNEPCRAVVASKQNNARLVELIDGGDIAWHHLNVRILPAG